MEKTLRLTLLLAAVLLTAGCEKNNPLPTPDNNGGDNTNTEVAERLVVYAVGNDESRLTLTTEGEWETLLEQFCDYAQSGNTVMFYNVHSSTTPSQGGTKGGAYTKETPTITTADREELKRWMKAMEKEGRTVRVTYDDQHGTWHGEAYTTAPANNTQGILIGTWRFNCMVVTHVGSDGTVISSDLYTTEENGGSWYYAFSVDGTLTITINGMDGTMATDNGTWSLSDDGVLCSELLPSGACWNVNWITPQTLIMSSADLGTEEGDIYYQIQFEAVTSIE